MRDGSSLDRSSFDTWSKLIESTMKGNPAVQASAEQAVEGGNDAWTALIDQLWKANPYSKLAPLDPAEITRAFQQIWTYLTTPFFMAMPGFEVTEIAPWQEDGEIWRGLRARFPDTLASHSKEQDFYFGDDFLLRRHDYHLEIAGGAPVAQYVYDIVEADGIRFPTKRRAYLRGPHMKPIHDLLLISLDLSNFMFTTE